jgi:hypothetical protein
MKYCKNSKEFKEMKYKSTTGFYSDADGTKIPFYFEIGIFHEVEALKRNNINSIFKQAINGSALIYSSYVIVLKTTM